MTGSTHATPLERPDTLIVGGSGYLGAALLDRLGAAGLATYRNRPISGGIQFDSARMRLRDVVDLDGFTQAVLLLGESRTAVCATEPERTDEININSITRVLDDLAAHGVKPVFMSSDAVFEGRTGGYTEQSETLPTMRYGVQKLAVERYIRAKFDDFLIIRASKVIDSDPKGTSLLAKWLDDIRQARTIKCATDHVFCPIDREDLNEVVVRAIRAGVSGIQHAAGPRAVTYWELFHTYLEALPLSAAEVDVRPALINDFSVAGERRPVNNAMISDLLYDRLGVHRSDPQEVCMRFRKRLGPAADILSRAGAASAERRA